jgi:hypothetical protein
MCRYCGFPSPAVHWTEAGAVTSADRAQARGRCAEVLQAILPAYGLTMRYGALAPGFQLSRDGGEWAAARDVDDLWALAEAMAGRAVDPLDPRFTEATSDAG